MINSMATCKDHAGRDLMRIVGGGESPTLIVRRLDGQDDLMKCGCGKPADWYFRPRTDLELKAEREVR